MDCSFGFQPFGISACISLRAKCTMYQAQDGGIVRVVNQGQSMLVPWSTYRSEFDAHFQMWLWFIRSMPLEQVMKLGDWYLLGYCLGRGGQS